MKIQSLCKSFADQVLFSDLTIDFGIGLFFIEGQSGSGKSTLLNILAGYDQPSSGQVFCDEEDTFSVMIQSKATVVSNISLEKNIILFYGKEYLENEEYLELKKILHFNLEKKKSTG